MHVFEEKSGIEPPREARLDVAVEAHRVVLPEDQRLSGGLRREAAEWLGLTVEQHLGAPDEAVVARLTERRVAVREVGSREVPPAVVVFLDPRRVRQAAAEVDAVRVVEVEVCGSPTEIREFRVVARVVVTDLVVLGAHLIVPPAGECQVLG